MSYSDYPFDQTAWWDAKLALDFDRAVGQLCFEVAIGKLSVEELGQAVLELRAEHNTEYLSKWIEEVI